MNEAPAQLYSRLELLVLERLWPLGRGSVRAVLEAMHDPKQRAYTTIQTIMRRLELKGAVRIVGKEARAHVFEPVVTREEVYARLMHELLEAMPEAAIPQDVGPGLPGSALPPPAGVSPGGVVRSEVPPRRTDGTGGVRSELLPPGTDGTGEGQAAAPPQALWWRLNHALPNPLPYFIGRDEEVTRLRTAIERGPLVAVWGMGGLGKTSLVLHTLHRHFDPRIDQIQYFTLQPDTPLEHLLLDIIRTLSQLEGIEARDWPGLLPEPRLLLRSLLELAERGPWWLVLDDMHHADPGALSKCVIELARYTRHSRWVMISRTDPELPHGLSQVLELAPLHENALNALARETRPDWDATSLQWAVRRSFGSPWRLVQALTGRLEHPSRDPDAFWKVLSPPAQGFLRSLTVLRAPLPLEALAALAALPDAEGFALLRRHGFIDRIGEGWRVHDVVRQLMREDMADSEWHALEETAAAALMRCNDPLALLEGFRLGLNLGQFDAVAAQLEHHGQRLLGAGYGPELWELLKSRTVPALEAWRLHIAAELGDPRILAHITEPPRPTMAQRLDWARVKFRQGDFPSALAVLEPSSQPGPAFPPELDWEVRILRSYCLIAPGRAQDTLIELEDVRPTDPSGQLLVDLLRAAARYRLGQDGTLVVGHLQPLEWKALPPQQRLRLGNAFISNLIDSGRYQQALELGEQLQQQPAHVLMCTYLGRSLLLRCAHASALLGRLEPMLSLCRSLGPLVTSAWLGLAVKALEMWVCAIHGTYADLTPHRMKRLCFEARARGNTLAYYSLVDQMRIVALKRADLDLEAPGDMDITVGGPVMAREHALRGWERAVARGERLSVDAWPPGGSGFHGTGYFATYLRFFYHHVATQASLIVGDLEAADHHNAEAAQALQTSELRLLDGEHAMRSCELLLLRGDLQELRRQVQRLELLGARMPSPQYALEARFFALAALLEPFEPASLERISAALQSAPVAARRAQALLGGHPSLDVLDRRLIDAIEHQRGWRHIEELGQAAGLENDPAGGGRALWIDAHHLRAWLPGGDPVDFSQSPLLWHLLVTLVGQGGSVTKEALTRALWPGVDYHPLHHDPRLRKVISRLRHMLEPDSRLPDSRLPAPSQPDTSQPDSSQPEAAHSDLLVTTASGYALKGRVRILHPPTLPASPAP